MNIIFENDISITAEQNVSIVNSGQTIKKLFPNMSEGISLQDIIGSHIKDVSFDEYDSLSIKLSSDYQLKIDTSQEYEGYSIRIGEVSYQV